jgi:hypothetical protein
MLQEYSVTERVRRYALFTLVGVAGEDNLDAPDLVAPTRNWTGSVKLPGVFQDHVGSPRIEA